VAPRLPVADRARGGVPDAAGVGTARARLQTRPCALTLRASAYGAVARGVVGRSSGGRPPCPFLSARAGAPHNAATAAVTFDSVAGIFSSCQKPGRLRVAVRRFQPKLLHVIGGQQATTTSCKACNARNSLTHSLS